MTCNLAIVKIDHRTTAATKVQEVLTNFGCNIKTRIGFHHTADDSCAEDGVVVLQLCGDKKEIDGLIKTLNEFDKVTAKFIEI